MKNPHTRRIGRLPALAALAMLTAMVAACSAPTQQDVIAASFNREAALAAALPMPDAALYTVQYLAWDDTARHRPVQAKLYLPAAQSGPVPLIVFSHGIGGSREGYTYLGKHWAANGYASLHLQHAGSDRNVWFGNPLEMVSRLQNAARETEAIDRARDVSFALDQVLNGESGARFDPKRVVAAGHSYGANTTLLVSGAEVERDGRLLSFRDPRVQAAVIISAPPFYGETRLGSILAPVQIPTLHITATADDIRIPGYFSAASDRTDVFAATGSRAKTLAVFHEGSHSMFTDRLGTGGQDYNPRVKAATRELALAFFRSVFDGQSQELGDWPERHRDMVQRFETSWKPEAYLRSEAQ
jgi:dienelactone hydrolase